ncbi:hypothetical protein [Mangrovibrevibacter kandeliae]|uniref:hypothetical protein n=1 Tax=Mangrovibrevibacter kandeliae TaxID=2968473 RepID=UPI0021180196|nr:hypothetical protein [Aurantimonas sp. CSK15Z-1]MCQ8784163.1 hypothetical protein [Aurantimonas sp. CSK15Z-1]MCQ8784276.1 hypothetical protein [Aurantimonas sp. CSK15Z-1]
MQTQARFDVEKNEAVIRRANVLSMPRIIGFTAALAGLVCVAGLVDGGEIARYARAAFWVGVLVPLVLLPLHLMERDPRINASIGIGPTGMAQSDLWSATFVEWTDVRVLILQPPMLYGRYGPALSALVAFTRDGRRQKIVLPPLDGQGPRQLLTILQAITARHGIEFVMAHTDEGDRRARQLGL